MASKSNQHSKRFVAVDANSLVHRAFHAFPSTLTTSDGVQVNAVYGFTSMLLRVLEELDPKYLVCAFDLKKPTFRHTEFTDYKAKRKPTDRTLIDQFPLVKEVLKAFNVPILECEGYEADDILGTLAEYSEEGKWKSEGLEMIVVTGDKDLLQIVTDKTHVWLPHGGFKDMRMYNPAAVVEKFGFGPELIPDFKGLAGDTSDNIPGVKGIGGKTATELIRTFGHLEGIYKNIEKIEKDRWVKLLNEGEESAELSRRLARIVSEVPIEVQLEDCLLRDFDRSKVVDIFQKFEFRSLLKRIPNSIDDKDNGAQMGLFAGANGSASTAKGDVGDDRDLPEVDIREIKFVDIEKMLTEEKIRKIIIYTFDIGKCAIGFVGKGKPAYCYTEDISGGCDAILRLLVKSKCDILVHGWESLVRKLYRSSSLLLSEKDKRQLLEKVVPRVFDLELAAYYLSTGQRDYSLKTLAFGFAGIDLPEEDVDPQGYIPACIDAIRQIEKPLVKKLKDRIKSMGPPGKGVAGPVVEAREDVVKKVDTPLSLSLAEMSCNGIQVDDSRLEKKSHQLDREQESIEKEIYESVGHEFNVSSSQQLGDVLFNELKLPVQRRTKTGFSTDASVLQKLRGLHPCVDLVHKYREVVKINSTYVRPLLEYASASKDGRVHSTFNQTATSTGRLSSQDPNLQNIPTRSDLGKEIKSMFVAPKGKVLLEVDYSQVELRVMAHFSEDKLMVEDFNRGADFHVATAARILDKSESKISKDDRRVAKTINFGILYGLSAFGLSEALEIEREEAAAYIEDYFEEYSGVKEYLEGTIDFVRKNGYVEALLGRRRFISNARSGNRIVRAAAEREAINMPIQGTADDIMRVAMNRVYDWILKEDKDIRLLLQIHDALVFECDESGVEDAAEEIKELMGGVVKLKVPLVCEASWGNSLS